MKLGPFVLMKSTSFGRLMSTQTLLTEENSRLAAELGAGTTVHSFMHYPWTATTAPQRILEPDADSPAVTEAVERVVNAYRRCSADYVQPGKSMWDLIEKRNRPFVSALQSGNLDEARGLLVKMFQCDLIWGLGKYDSTLIDDMRRTPERSHAQLRMTDALVSLAQATGVMPLTSVEQQGVQPHLEALRVDLEQLLSRLESQTGLDVSSPAIGASYGCEIGEKFITIDSILHSYTLHRLIQLGAAENSNIVEIGGGFGCLAQLAHRAGLKTFAVYDLPWVNAIQGYYLIMSLPPQTVRLYGETEGTISVNPFWAFDSLPDRSVDLIVNTDSLPEMGADTAGSYIKQIARILSRSGQFLSINQEARASNGGFGLQNSVFELAKELGALCLKSRSLYWMRQGYAEEIYVPAN